VLPFWPLSQGEIGGRVETAVGTLLDEPAALVTTTRFPTDRPEYTRRVLVGGMPVPLSRPPGARRSRWFADYLKLVVGEVLKHLSWAEAPLEVSHFRTHYGVEADIVIEGSDARIAAIEVKASSQVQPADLRGLRLLRDRFPDRFGGGTVLYLGPLAYTAEDRIHVVPIDRLWM
jgi:predicted AAA+ superfamily ATPase